LGRCADSRPMRSSSTMHVAQGLGPALSAWPRTRISCRGIHRAHRQHSQRGAIGRRRDRMESFLHAHKAARIERIRRRRVRSSAGGGLQFVSRLHGPRLYLLGSWSSTHALTRAPPWGLERERAPDDIPSVAAARGLMHAAARWGRHWKGLHGFPRRGRAWSVGYVARSEGRGARANPGGVHWSLVVGGRIRGECRIVQSFVPEHGAVSWTLAASTSGGRGAIL
jgi:hypothetical protein